MEVTAEEQEELCALYLLVKINPSPWHSMKLQLKWHFQKRKKQKSAKRSWCSDLVVIFLSRKMCFLFFFLFIFSISEEVPTFSHVISKYYLYFKNSCTHCKIDAHYFDVDVLCISSFLKNTVLLLSSSWIHLRFKAS